MGMVWIIWTQTMIMMDFRRVRNCVWIQSEGQELDIQCLRIFVLRVALASRKMLQNICCYLRDRPDQNAESATPQTHALDYSFWYWLKSTTGKSHFLNLKSYGTAQEYGLSDSHYGLRMNEETERSSASVYFRMNFRWRMYPFDPIRISILWLNRA